MQTDKYIKKLYVMTELTSGIFNASKKVYASNRGSILRTIVYTIGHFAIAITVLMLVADVSFYIALTDAIVEPLANSIWYFVLDKFWASKISKKNNIIIFLLSFVFLSSRIFSCSNFTPIFFAFFIKHSLPFSLKYDQGFEY